MSSGSVDLGSDFGAPAPSTVNSFETINCPAGTDPVADSSTDTLNLTSADSSVVITGNATTDTVDFSVGAALSGYALLAGRAGGQTLDGDTAASGNLSLDSTAHATKGRILNLSPVSIGVSTVTDPGNLAIKDASSAPKISLHDSTGARVAQIDRSATLGLVLRDDSGVTSFMDAYSGTTRLWTIENAAMYCRFGNGQIGNFGVTGNFAMSNGGSGVSGSGLILVSGIDSGGAGVGGNVLIQSATGASASVTIMSGVAGATRIKADNTGIGFLAAAPAAQQTGGAATAGAVYTAAEQSMLQKAYDCLRTFGLLS